MKNSQEQMKLPLSGRTPLTEIPEEPKDKPDFKIIPRVQSEPVSDSRPLTPEELAKEREEIKERAQERKESHGP